MKKSVASLLIITFIVSLLISCSKYNEINSETIISTEHMDMYTYLIQQTEMEFGESYSLLPTQVHDNRFFFCYIKRIGNNSTFVLDEDRSHIRNVIMVASHSADGKNLELLELDNSNYIYLIGFQIQQNNIISIIAVKMLETEIGHQELVVHVTYDFEGNELSQMELPGLLPEGITSNNILQTMITEDGTIILLIQGEQKNYLLLFNAKTEITAELELNTRYSNYNSLISVEDGRILVLDEHEDGDTGEIVTVLKTIDVHAERFREIYPIDGTISSHLFPVNNFLQDRSDFPYDFLISSNENLYGYSMVSCEQITLLNYNEIGIMYTIFFDMHFYVAMFDNGTFCVLTHEWIGSVRKVNLYILTPVLRSEMPEQIILTLGGLYVDIETRFAVNEFNKMNSYYHIKIYDYYQESNEDYYAAINNLNTDLVIGRGPDILLDAYGNLSVYGNFIDLYPFIDEDSELSRSDFIPNILQSLERADGTLPVITTGFHFNTFIGTVESVGHIDLWTSEAMIHLAEKTQVQHPFGTDLSSEMFVFMLLMTDKNLIDWDIYKSNLNSNAFISLLETSKLFPRTRYGHRDFTIERYMRLVRGEQPVLYHAIANTNTFHFLSEVIGDEMILMGHPTEEGEKFFITARNRIGINAATKNADAAWEFLRTLLQNPSHSQENRNFPIRTDLFEEQITNVTTPQYKKNIDGSIYYDSNGNPVELPCSNFTIHTVLQDGVGLALEELELFAMSEIMADMLRNSIYTAKSYRYFFSDQLFDIISSDLSFYYDGARTAEDTARIMQSRVQIYLSEQELIIG